MNPLQIEIRDNQLILSIGLDTLAWAAENHPDRYDGENDRWLYTINDHVVFANDVLTELKDEEEDGTTLVHRMLDEATMRAISNGSQAVSEAQP